MLTELPILSINLDEAPIEYLLDQVLSKTDLNIVTAILDLREKSGKFPTAMEILDKLSKSSKLKKTQLYDRLSKLSDRGFISMKLLPRPRQYYVNAKTIDEGVKNWVDEQKSSIEGLVSELQSIQYFLKQVDAGRLAAAVSDKLSIVSR